MDRYAACFERLARQQQAALVPFVVLGDPNRQDSIRIIESLIESGADALELGFPFSDPLADGPTIQAAMDRALRAGVTPDDCFAILGQLRQAHPQLPIGLLVYANIIHALGLDEFYGRCAGLGVDSVLVADVPVTESQPFREAATKHGVLPILLCPPNINRDALTQVAQHGAGYTYLLSRPGVTGTNVAAGRPVGELLSQLKQLDAAPPLLGFGISTPQHVADAIHCGAAGVICGSAIIERIERNLPDLDAIVDELTNYVEGMKSATR